jgi:PEP-CTERM motif-containing protein
MKLSTVLMSLAVCACLSMPASAAPLVEETFDYPVGPLDGANGGTGFTGPWVGSGTYDGTTPWQMNVAGSPVIAYDGYDAQGNTIPNTSSLTWSDALAYNARAARPITAIDTSTQNTLWVGASYLHSGIYAGSGLVDLIDSSDPSKSLYLETYRGLDAPVIGPDGQPTGDTAAAVHFRVKLGTSPGQTEPFSYQNWGAMGIDVPIFLLAKFEFTPDYTLALLNYYQSPEALPTEEPVAWDAWVSVPEEWNLNIDSLGLRMGRSNRYNNVGEVRVGTTMQDVMLVPEPATLALLGLGGLAMLRRRK